MKIIYNISRSNKKFRRPVLAIGVFDGIHIGHQKLLAQVVNTAKKINGTPMVMTFHPHPLHVLHPEINLPLIVSLEHRLKIFEKFGIKVAVVVEFTKKFSQLSPQVFIKSHLTRLKPEQIFIGDDFRFGQNRSGTIELFTRHGFNVSSVKAVAGELGKVSSTQIRHYIIEGNLKKAQRFLGHPVSLMGKVVAGDRRGKSLGFPTANIKPDNSLIPPKGVYAVLIEIGGRIYQGMTNIGQRPSFTPLDERIIVETNIFDFNKALYGKSIIIHFIKRIRSEKRFSSPRQLVSQLKKDAIKSRKILKDFAK